MKSSPNSPLCYRCRYRGTLVGDCHSKCIHREVSPTDTQSQLVGALLSIFGGSRPNTGACQSQIGSVRVKFNRHGIENGWACWPFNFDPVWLEECTGFEKEKKRVQNV